LRFGRGLDHVVGSERLGLTMSRAWAPPEIPWWSVPELWPDETVAILCGGPSLTQEQVDYLEGKCRVIAINRAGIPRPRHHEGQWCYAPFADMLFASDVGHSGKPQGFWLAHQDEALAFPGIKVAVRAISPSREEWRRMEILSAAGVKILRHSGLRHPSIVPRHEGISSDPGVVHGNNSLFMVMSVIHYLAPRSTVLWLGADMRGVQWHGGYRGVGQPEFPISIIPNFATLVRPLQERGITVLNCTPKSAIPWWEPNLSVFDVL
jgi:hypothetical protein